MKFLVFPNLKKDVGLNVTKKYVDYLISKGNTVYMNEDICETYSDRRNGIHFCSAEIYLSEAEIALVIGGDGTILKAAREIYGRDIPIIGINLGKVGYMSELEVEEYALLDEIAETDCISDIPSSVITDERMMLNYEVLRKGDVVYSGIALNEAVVSKCDITRMIDVDLMLDREVIASYQCDGIIASTPTGSTAYSMSAGGAIIDPKLECISVIPFCPYLCINSSPIIFSKDSEIEILFRSERGTKAYISVDGGEGFELNDGDIVKITSAKHRTKLLRVKKTDFYKLLNTKLTNRMLELTERK